MEVSGQRHAPAALYPEERACGTNVIGVWVGSGQNLGVLEKRKKSCLCRGSKCDFLVQNLPGSILSYLSTLNVILSTGE